MHDPRLLRTLTGGGGAREVSGVDPTRGTYHALPGETPHGITKKLTGQTERTQELLAANPGKPDSDPVWNIPPGWLHYAGDTGAVLPTARKYLVVKDDWPQKIASKLGAFPARAKWWSELRAANPHKATENGNWTYLYPGEEIGIPNEWPDHPLAVAVDGVPAQPSTPGVPAPGKTTTLDPAVVPHTQALLASWALRNPGDCNPSDFGRNPMDLVSGFTPRTTQALASFQTWWNKKQPNRPLATTGELDQATYNALVEENNASGTVFSGGTKTEEQTTTQQTQESASPPPLPSLPSRADAPQAPSAELPPGVSVQASSKPGHVLLVTPMGSFDLPATPGSKPGTVVVDVPLLGKREIPAPAASQQQSTPSPPPPPPPPAAPLAGLPPGVSVQASTKPGHVLVVTPMGSFDLPASPGSKPGTVFVDVPLLGKHEIPAPTAQPTPEPPEEVEQPPNWEGAGGSPKLDDTFSEAAKRDILLFLEACNNPYQLEEVAEAYEQSGYPLAAKAMRDRANVLRQQQGGGSSPGWEYYPQTNSAPPSTADGNNKGSLLPVIAVVAAGLAFS
ncbi:hypothetical protein [Polyangium spumosum]|nr:hypothetical protein [Polyangium spumosum]